MKKTCQYRSDKEEKADIEEYAKKKNDIELKKKMLPSLFLQNPEESLVAEKEKKAGKSKNARRRRKRNQLKEAENKVKLAYSVRTGKVDLEEVGITSLIILFICHVFVPSPPSLLSITAPLPI